MRESLEGTLQIESHSVSCNRHASRKKFEMSLQCSARKLSIERELGSSQDRLAPIRPRFFMFKMKNEPTASVMDHNLRPVSGSLETNASKPLAARNLVRCDKNASAPPEDTNSSLSAFRIEPSRLSRCCPLTEAHKAFSSRRRFKSRFLVAVKVKARQLLYASCKSTLTARTRRQIRISTYLGSTAKASGSADTDMADA